MATGWFLQYIIHFQTVLLPFSTQENQVQVNPSQHMSIETGYHDPDFSNLSLLQPVISFTFSIYAQFQFGDMQSDIMNSTN